MIFLWSDAIHCHKAMQFLLSFYRMLCRSVFARLGNMAPVWQYIEINSRMISSANLLDRAKHCTNLINRQLVAAGETKHERILSAQWRLTTDQQQYKYSRFCLWAHILETRQDTSLPISRLKNTFRETRCRWQKNQPAIVSCSHYQGRFPDLLYSP